MLQLRPYQQDLLRRVQDNLAANPKARLMLQLPTGGGKTVIAGALLADWLQNGRKAVWLTHRKELAEQTRRMLTDGGVSVITNVNWTPGEDAPAMAGGTVILMAQTVGRRATRLSNRTASLPHRTASLPHRTTRLPHRTTRLPHRHLYVAQAGQIGQSAQQV